MSAATKTSTYRLVGDLLAGRSEDSKLNDLVADTGRHLSGVQKALTQLVSDGFAEKVSAGTYRMTGEQRERWATDKVNNVPPPRKVAGGGFKGWLARREGNAAPGAQAGTDALRFALWSDGDMLIDGLGRHPITVPAATARQMADMVTALPEGALAKLATGELLQARLTINLGGKCHTLSPTQAEQLLDYLERMPARPGPGTTSPFGQLMARVHRIETPEDLKDD